MCVEQHTFFNYKMYQRHVASSSSSGSNDLPTSLIMTLNLGLIVTDMCFNPTNSRLLYFYVFAYHDPKPGVVCR